MWDVLSWLLFILFITGLLVVGGLLLRGYLTTGSTAGALTAGFFAPKPDKRLDIVDQTTIDGRRRLVLIRRDDVEHLVMTGGPVDVVIETGIGEKVKPKPEVVRADMGKRDSDRGTAARPARTFGQAVGE